MSLGAAFVGAAFSPINPFQVVIAQQVADVPRLSGWAFRTVFLVIALIVWIAATMRHANRTCVTPERDPAHDEAVASSANNTRDVRAANVTRHLIILLVVVVTFAFLAWGMLFQGWDFDHLTALFFLMGVAAGLIGKLGFGGTARAFGEGFREMSLAAVLVGVARAIFVVLQDGRIVDTIVHGLFTPIADLPRAVAGIAMMAAHVGLHLAVPSVSGQAVLTMPIMGPLADLLGLSRQVAVLAYQYGAGTMDMLTPTNGALMAVLGAARVGYDEWFRFAAPWWAFLATLGAVALVVALGIGLQ
jgi:uncharacterized ion transporter superfamily protein YfcC